MSEVGNWGLPVADMAALRKAVPRWDIVSYVDAVARKVMVLESSKDDGTTGLLLALSDPQASGVETWALQRCAKASSEATLSVLASVEDLEVVLHQHEKALRAMDDVEFADGDSAADDVAAVITLGSLKQESSSVVRMVNSTLYDALKLQASDIHLECDVAGMRVAYRLDGVLVSMTEVQGSELAEQIISRVKVMAELDIAERRIPQDGRFKVRVNGRDIDFRVSVMPSIFGEDAVLRLLDRQSLSDSPSGLTLESLGLAPKVMSHMRRLSQKPHGMLLVTGPTGSGKTTTLYAAISEIHTGRDKIITIEDPVEYRLPRVLQIPVNEKKGLTFARGLRSILRHDPDKIMIGEIRDGETAQIAVQAALTGHLVLTTVHANNVFDVLGRFMHMGVDAYSFASSLNGIVAQRLLRINCPECTSAAAPQDEELQALELTPEQVSDWRFCAGSGCGHCRGTGYKGRVAVAEVLILNDELREMVAAKAPVSEMKQRAAESGWVDLRVSALDLVASGKTTLSEVLRVAG